MKLLTRKRPLKLDKSKTYLLACSGGPDSMTLFHMLYKENYKFEVAFVNYHSRPESDAEEVFLEKICRNCSVFCNKWSQKIENSGNFEAAAREIRYNFFKKIIDEKPYLDGVLIAHNADDFIETYILQEERKNYPQTYGLAETSIYKGVKIYRPILNYDKDFILNYCNKHKIEYCLDKTNNDKKYKRNKIRHEIIFKLSREKKQEYINLIEEKNKELSKLYKKFDKDILSHFETLYSKNIEVLQRFLFYFVSKHGDFELDPRFKNVVNDILNQNFNKLYSFKNFYLIYDSEGLTFYEEDPRKYTYNLTREEFNKIGHCDFEGDIRIRPLKEFKEIQINNHTKKVNRFFIDTKMPLSIRMIWPCVFIDKMGVIYTPRYRKNFKKSKGKSLKFSPKSLQNLNIF